MSVSVLETPVGAGHAGPEAARGAAPADSARRQQQYDELVACAAQRSIYCQRWWLDAVAPQRYRILTVERGGSLLAAWPVVFGAGGADVVMPSMTQKLGILYASMTAKYAEALSNEHEFAGELIEQLGAHGAFYHQFHERFTNWLPFFWRGYQQTTRYTYLIENLKDPDGAWRAMRTCIHRLINKAAKLGIRIEHELDFERFLDLNDMVFQRQELAPPVGRDLLRRIEAACAARGCRRIFAAFDPQGRLHAAIYVAWQGGVAYGLMSASDPQLRASGALTLTIWEALRWLGSVADTFDCEGSMIQGVEFACRGMGGRQTPYFAISRAAPRVRRPGVRGVAGRLLARAAQRLLGAECAGT
jgi:hypothetical protein